MAGLARFVPNPIGIGEALHGPNGPVYKGIVERCIMVSSEAKRRCPVETGRLRASIRWQVTAGPNGYVGSDVNYARMVHEGTRAHDIHAKPGGVLAFTLPVERFVTARGLTYTKRGAKGQTIFATVVHHPGTKGVPFLTDALQVLRV